MSEPQSSSAAAAGIMLLLVIVVCSGVGGGIGALVGSPAPFAVGGGALGLVAGFALVYSRFKNI